MKKEYKIITIHQGESNINPYKHGTDLINEYVNKGWTLEHVTNTGVKGELAITMSRMKSEKSKNTH